MTRRSKRKESEPGANGAAASDAAAPPQSYGELLESSAAVDLTAALDQLDELASRVLTAAVYHRALLKYVHKTWYHAPGSRPRVSLLRRVFT